MTPRQLLLGWCVFVPLLVLLIVLAPVFAVRYCCTCALKGGKRLALAFASLLFPEASGKNTP